MRKAHIADVQRERIRVSLVALRRLFQRKELTALWGGAGLDYSDLRLLDAVALSAPESTVGDVARLLGLDPSRASREVARAVSRGLVERRASPGDARRVVLAITARGDRLRARGSELTRARIEQATAGWSAADRAAFAELFARFVGGILPA